MDRDNSAVSIHELVGQARMLAILLPRTIPPDRQGRYVLSFIIAILVLMLGAVLTAPYVAALNSTAILDQADTIRVSAGVLLVAAGLVIALATYINLVQLKKLHARAVEAAQMLKKLDAQYQRLIASHSHAQHGEGSGNG